MSGPPRDPDRLNAGLAWNEDPVSGLERVSSMSNMSNLSRRRRQEETDALTRRSRAYRRESVDHCTLSSNFESLNYEITENQLYRDEERSSHHQVNLWRYSINRWVACFFIGVFTAMVAASIDIIVATSSAFKSQVILKELISTCNNETQSISHATGASCMWKVQCAWIAYNCILVGIASLLVVFVSNVAGGSGIPQIKSYLNGIKIPEVLMLKTLVVKAVGVACAVAGGLAAGKEGPMIHSGAIVGAGVSSGRSKALKIDTGFFTGFRNDREKRDFVAAGAAAGVSAAFGAPIGGVLFALEEGSSFWNQNLTWRLFFSAMISSFTLNSILSWYHHRDGWLSWSGLANFGEFQNKDYNIWEIPLFLLVGVIGGCTGALFNRLNTSIAEFRKKYVASKFQRIFECLLLAASSAFLGFVTIVLVDDCQPVGVNPDSTEVLQMWCKKGEYSAVAQLFFHTPEENVKSLLHSPINSYRPTTLLLFSMQYFFLTLWTFGISVPSGVFIPALLTGAAWGRLFGIGANRLLPGIVGSDPGKYALAGAAAQLGGLVRMTISLTAIIMEATREITFGLPIMLVLMVTKWVGDIFNEGIYDTYIELAEVPILGWNPPKMSRNILAENVMRADVIALEKQERVARVYEILRSTNHHGFPVVDRIEESLNQTTLPDYGHLKGIILRTHLIALLKHKAFAHTVSSNPLTAAELEDPDIEIEDIHLTAHDEQRWLDLENFMHPHPHRVPLNASLPFIFRLFRGLGLRYLLVINDQNKLRGIITRKDVARFRERRHKKTYVVEELFISEDRSH